MSNTKEILEELRKPFSKDDLEFRVGRSGINKKGGAWASLLAYITSRAVMEKLDSTVGANNWEIKYRREGNGFMCSISLRLDGEWITKEDGSEDTEIESYKGGISSALKRAAVLWGIGRYLYEVGDIWALIVPEQTDVSRWAEAKGRDGTKLPFHWEVDWGKFPKWALPTQAETSKIVEDKSLNGLKQLKESVVGNKEASQESAKPAGEKPKAPGRVAAKAPAPAAKPAVVARGTREDDGAGSTTQKIEAIRKEITEAPSLEELRGRWIKNTAIMSTFSEAEITDLSRVKDEKKAELAQVQFGE